MKDEEPSDTLPRRWASSRKLFRYVSRSATQRRFTVKFSENIHGAYLVVILKTIDDGKTTVLNLKIEDEVNEGELSSRSPKKIFTRLPKLISQIETELLKPNRLTSPVKTISFTFADERELFEKLRVARAMEAI